MRVSKPAIAAAFTDVLKERGLTEATASRLLDVHRESFNKYLRGKTAPSRHLVAKAVQLWEPEMAKHGFKQESILSGSPASRAAQPVQLALFSEELHGKHVAVTVESKSVHHVELALTVRVA